MRWFTECGHKIGRSSDGVRYQIRAAQVIVLAGILSSPVDLAAQRARDEVVELSNGDRVTGEIKGLDRSQLTVRTIDLGTVQIRWQRVVRLNSNRRDPAIGF